MYSFYERYNDKYPDIVYCLNLGIESVNKATYRQVRFQGTISDDVIEKQLGEGEALTDLFIYAIENKEYSKNFVQYDKVFSIHGIPMKEINIENAVKETVLPASRSKTTTPPVIKKETSESIPIANVSQTELKSNAEENKPLNKSASVSSMEKKQWTAPKLKQRGIASMFKKKVKSEDSSSKEPSLSSPELPSEKNKAVKIENKFQFTSKKLIDKRKEEDKMKEQERVKIVQDRLNSLKHNDKMFDHGNKRCKTEEKSQLLPEEEGPVLKKQKTLKVEHMDDIFHSDSDCEGIVSSPDKDEPVTSEKKPSSDRKATDGNTTIPSDTTSFIELVVGKQEPENEKKAEKKTNKKSKPVLQLESDSQDSSDSDS